MTLDLPTLREALDSSAAAFRCVTPYQPAGGTGDKVFPPTYEGGKYATEERIDPETGALCPCVLLDSVQSQANRMELALLEAHRAGKVRLPLIVTTFDHDLPSTFAVTSLEAPHRAADALFRDSLLNGVMFRKSAKGRLLDTAHTRDATGLFGLCPTALVFGLWDSTGPRGGLGAKFQRALVSEIVGYSAVKGIDTTSRIDAAEIRVDAGPLYERVSERDDAPRWTLDKETARHEESATKKAENSRPKTMGKEGKPSEANHGNVTPDYAFARDHNRQVIHDVVTDPSGRQRREPRILGGFTISRALQTTVLSLSALRRLRFPIDQTADSGKTELAARTALAALGLAAGALARVDVDLRSRCQLFAESEPRWELLERPGKAPREFGLDPEAALKLLNLAVADAQRVGLPPWDSEVKLTPSYELIQLVRRSQEHASKQGERT